MAELFGEVLELCADAGLVRVGVIAVDGTKVAGDRAQQATRNYEQIAREILAGMTRSMPRRRAVWRPSSATTRDRPELQHICWVGS